MDLDQAAEERLRESAEVDRMVKTTMLPLEVEKTRAETQRLMALSSLAMSKRTEMADSASQTAILEQFLNEPFDNVVRPRGGSTGGSQSSTGPSFSSGLSSGGGYELDTSGGLFGNEQTSVDFDSLPTPNMENLTNPKYAMVSAPTGVSTDQPPGAAENQILEARAADSGKTMRNPLDWDANPSSAPASPQNPKGAATSEQEQELKKIRSELYPNQNPLESLPNAQSKNEGPGLGNFIADSVSDAKYFENQAALFPKRKGGGKAPEALAYEARAYAIRQKLPGEAASRYGIQDPSIINQLYSTKTGVTRSASEIDKIYDTMQKGYVELPDNQGALQRVPVESVEDAIARVEQLRTLMPRQGTAGSSDPGKDLGQLADNHKKAEESYAAATASGDERAIARAKSIVELYEGQLNAATEGKFFRDRHTGIQQNLITAITHLNNPKVNYKGVAYDQVDKAKQEDNLSSNDFFVQAATSGMMPTFSVGSDGRPNLDAADNFLKYYGVENTIVASYKKDGSLGLFNYNPTGEKKLTAIQTKAPQPTGGEKPAPAEGNPFRAKAEESQIAQGTQDMDDEIYKIQVEMTKLDQSRTRLIDQRNQTEKPFPSLQGFPGAISAEKAADTYDEITAKMRELAKEKSELLEKRRAIKNKK
jgi:hypothetical protein